MTSLAPIDYHIMKSDIFYLKYLIYISIGTIEKFGCVEAISHTLKGIFGVYIELLKE